MNDLLLVKTIKVLESIDLRLKKMNQRMESLLDKLEKFPYDKDGKEDNT